MSSEDARFWLDLIAGFAVVAWVLGAWFVMRTTSLCREPVEGVVEVDASPATVSSRVAQHLATVANGSPLHRSVVSSATEREVRWESRGAFRHTGSLRVEGSGRRTRAAFAVTVQSGLLVAARLVHVVAAIVVGGLYYLLLQSAVPSQDESVRVQVVQMVQSVHLLWPPFLLAGLARTLRRRVVDELQRVVGNTKFA